MKSRIEKMALKAQHSAVCYYCDKRHDLYVSTQTIRLHRIVDKSKRCPGSCTTDYRDIQNKHLVKRISRPLPCRLPPLDPSTVLLKAKSLGTETKRLRTMVGYDWKNRWEREFGVKVSDEIMDAIAKRIRKYNK